MATLLHIESSARYCSVCISRDDLVLDIQESTEPYQHGQKITTLIEACCRQSGVALSELDAVAVSQGPGSYTALRVGMSTAKGICFALDLPLIGVPTLQALAAGARAKMSGQDLTSDLLFCPMIDARRMEVYTNLFDQSLTPREQDRAMIIDETAFQDDFAAGHPILFTGDGADKCRPVITHPQARFLPLEARASHLVSLALAAFARRDFLDLAYAEPFYLKSPNITKPKKLL